MQKLTVKLDPETDKKAQDVLAQLRAGGDFKALAAQYSDDESTKQIGGEFGVVDKGNRNVSPQTVDRLFKTAAGEVSDIIIVPYADGYALEIVKDTRDKQATRQKAHIFCSN